MGSCAGGCSLHVADDSLSQTRKAVSCSPKKGDGGSGPALGVGLRRAMALQMAHSTTRSKLSHRSGGREGRGAGETSQGWAMRR
eukprot:7363825-Prymnesium_polylepis.1